MRLVFESAAFARATLLTLEDLDPQMAFSDVQAIVEAELGYACRFPTIPKSKRHFSLAMLFPQIPQSVTIRVGQKKASELEMLLDPQIQAKIEQSIHHEAIEANLQMAMTEHPESLISEIPMLYLPIKVPRMTWLV